MRNNTFKEIKENMDMLGCFHIDIYGCIGFECEFNTEHQARTAEMWLNEQLERFDGEITNVVREGTSVIVDIK